MTQPPPAKPERGDGVGLIEQCETLLRLIRHGIEALRDRDGDAITASATLHNVEELDRRVSQLAGAVEEIDALRDFILSRPMTSEDYAEFKAIPSVRTATSGGQ